MPVRLSKLPPIRVHRERVDDETDAIVACCFHVRRRQVVRPATGRGKNRTPQSRMVRAYLYGITQFTLVKSGGAGIARAEARLVETFEAKGYLPLLGPCADMPGWGDYE